MVERRLFLFFQIDTNRINARQGLPPMNALECWHAAGLIEILLSDVAQAEAVAGGNATRAQKALSYIFAIGTSETSDELEFKKQEIGRAHV